MTDSKIIKIACRAAECVPFERLKIIQDELKSLSQDNFNALKQEIIEKGFSFAIHVWDDGKDLCVLDGTQRHRVLSALLKEGYQLEQGVPVAYVDAPDEKTAVLKLLGAAGAYGHPEEEGLYALMEKHQLKPIDVPNIRLPGIDLNKFTQGYYEEPNPTEDEVPEPPKVAKTKTGELWILGEHRLLCADCTVKENVERLMSYYQCDCGEVH